MFWICIHFECSKHKIQQRLYKYSQFKKLHDKLEPIKNILQNERTVVHVKIYNEKKKKKNSNNMTQTLKSKQKVTPVFQYISTKKIFQYLQQQKLNNMFTKI